MAHEPEEYSPRLRSSHGFVAIPRWLLRKVVRRWTGDGSTLSIDEHRVARDWLARVAAERPDLLPEPPAPTVSDDCADGGLHLARYVVHTCRQQDN